MLQFMDPNSPTIENPRKSMLVCFVRVSAWCVCAMNVWNTDKYIKMFAGRDLCETAMHMYNTVTHMRAYIHTSRIVGSHLEG